MTTAGDIVPRASIVTDTPTRIKLSRATELIDQERDGRSYYSAIVEFSTSDMKTPVVREVTISRNLLDAITIAGQDAGVMGVPTWYEIVRTGEGFQTVYTVEVVANE